MSKYLALDAYMKSNSVIKHVVEDMYEIITDPESDVDDVFSATVSLEDALFNEKT